MTNKNKRTKPKTEKVRGPKPNPLAEALKPELSPTNEPTGLMTRGQLTALIFLTMGLSRHWQVGGAMRKETSVESSTMANNETADVFLPVLEASETCLGFFNDTGMPEAGWTPTSTCEEDGFNSLLKYKYAVGWQVAGMVLALFLQCWHIEGWLMRFNVGLIFTPLLPSVLTLLMVEPTLISKSAIFPQVIMALVLSYVGSPSSIDWIPFVGKVAPNTVPPANSRKSFQSLVLLSMAGLFAFQATLQWGANLLPGILDLRTSVDPIADTMQALAFINQEWLEAFTQTPSSLVMALLLVVDKLSLAMICLFAWFYFGEQQQRTFLMYAGIIYFCVSTYQWPSLDGHIKNITELKTIDWAITGFCLAAWIAPSLSSFNSSPKTKTS